MPNPGNSAPYDPRSRPIRRDALVKATTDADGNRVYEEYEGEAVTLTPEGCIDRAKIIGFFHCGHATTDGLGGVCGEPGCQNVSCKACFAQSRCAKCFKPLCLEHLRKWAVETGEISLCSRCLDELKRGKFWQGLLKTVLSPFVEFPK
jgi:hypothetical protein